MIQPRIWADRPSAPNSVMITNPVIAGDHRVCVLIGPVESLISSCRW